LSFDLGGVIALLDCPQLGDLVLAAPLATEPDAKLVAVGVSEDEGVAWIEAGAKPTSLARRT
jgi:hypothetical protein